MPDTTPIANDTAKILTQNRIKNWKRSSPLRSQSTPSAAI